MWDITKLYLEGRCMHRPTALGGALSELHRPNFFFLENDSNKELYQIWWCIV